MKNEKLKYENLDGSSFLEPENKLKRFWTCLALRQLVFEEDDTGGLPHGESDFA